MANAMLAAGFHFSHTATRILPELFWSYGWLHCLKDFSLLSGLYRSAWNYC